MQKEPFEAEWRTLADEALTGIVDWRTAHPQATFVEIETAVEERVARMRARMLEAAAAASAMTDIGACDVATRPACPACGQTLVARGQRQRTVRVPGGGAVTLRRSYTVCPACGAGLFPPG